MKRYYYDVEGTRCLYTRSDLSGPFLCPAEATPLRFNSPEECSEFLEENNFEGILVYKLICS